MGGRQGEVSMQALAQALGTSAPSVTEMVKKLDEKGLLVYRPYKGVRFTQTGERLAVHIVRRHRIWEAFVAQVLGYTGARVHELAEKLEHLCDDEFVNRLHAFLGYPDTDPHGDEIPSLPTRETIWPLSRWPIDTPGRLKRLPEDPYLAEIAYLLRLEAGKLLRLICVLPVDQIRLIEYEGHRLLIPPSLAEHLWVEEVHS